MMIKSAYSSDNISSRANTAIARLGMRCKQIMSAAQALAWRSCLTMLCHEPGDKKKAYIQQASKSEPLRLIQAFTDTYGYQKIISLT